MGEDAVFHERGVERGEGRYTTSEDAVFDEMGVERGTEGYATSEVAAFDIARHSHVPRSHMGAHARGAARTRIDRRAYVIKLPG